MQQDSTRLRVGFLADGDPATDLMTATYENDESGALLRVPYRFLDDPRGRWWSGASFHYGDDPDRTRYDYAPPSELNYFDHHGTVGLVDCRSGGASFGVNSAGLGVIRARFAVEGAHDAANFRSINGLQSEIDGLANWFNVAGHATNLTPPNQGVPLRVTTTLKASEQIHLARGLNLALVVSGTAPAPGSLTASYRTRAFLQTLTARGRPWSEHLEMHFAIRDLLRVAAWKPIHFHSHHAASTGETDPTLEPPGPAWKVVRSAITGLAEPTWDTNDRFLFYYSDIRRAGLQRWLRLSRAYERGMQPFIRLLELRGVTIDAALSQLGIAMEAMGYQSLVESGSSLKAARDARLQRRVELLLEECPTELSFDRVRWAVSFADAYNSVKHANRDPTDPALKHKLLSEGVELLRNWIALRLGVKPT